MLFSAFICFFAERFPDVKENTPEKSISSQRLEAFLLRVALIAKAHYLNSQR